jgi:hypothetical protein
MSANNISNFKEDINDINQRLNNLIQLVDTKKNFFNNVFFPDKDQNIPITLHNIHYDSSNKDNNFNDTEKDIKQYNFDQPNKIFILPSSDESGNETKNIYIPSFNQICDDIIDLEYLELIKEEKDLPKGTYPIVLFRGKEPLTNAIKVLSFVKSCINKDPYEIKILPIQSIHDTKDILSLFVKFYKYEEAKIITEYLNKSYNIQGELCFDKRESIDSNWYCVVFRMEGGGDQKLGKFVQLMDEIYKEINDQNKKFLINSIEGSCEGQINGIKCIKKLGEVFYCMIKVSTLEQAVTLCVKYNKTHDIKVNLHTLTYKMKKSEMPQILIEKEGIGEKKLNKQKINKNFKEDEMFQDDLAFMLFPPRKLLSRKHKRNKIKKEKNA